jgi:hypothetical protein
MEGSDALPNFHGYTIIAKTHELVLGDCREDQFNSSKEDNGRETIGGPLVLVLQVGEEDVGRVTCLTVWLDTP